MGVAIQQQDGTYAFQTSSGYVLTANGGGVPGTGFRTDIPLAMIGNDEKFTIEPAGGGAAYIRTFSDAYLTVKETE